MNVMKTAHKYAKHLISIGINLTYKAALKAALIRAHKEYKAMMNTILTASRNLYKVIDTTSKEVVGFVTASTNKEAIEKYRIAGGAAGYLASQQVSHGYPNELCTIYK